MSFNGMGTFVINSSGQPVVSGTTITSTAQNALTADLATGLTTTICRDGQSTITANIPWNSYKITGLGVASLSGDALSWSQPANVSTLVIGSLNGILLGNGASVVSVATAGTDYAKPSVASTWTAQQAFAGSTTAIAELLTNAVEVTTISATAATGTIAYDITTQSILYYTSSAAANWTVNFRGNSGHSLDSLMSTGQTLTCVFLVTQGSTAYYNSAVQVDGNAVTPKYQNGLAFSAGNPSGIDAYSYTIIKTGSAAFTVLAAQTQFK